MPQGVDPEDSNSSPTGNSISVATRAGASALPINDFPAGEHVIVWVDEVQANYLYNSTSGETVDGWNILSSTGGLARLILLGREIKLTPLDGTVTNDSVRLNSAITAMSGSGIIQCLPKFDIIAGIITILPFIIKSSLLFNHAGLPLKFYGVGTGDQLTTVGPGTRLLWQGNTADPVINITNSQTTVEISDMGIDTNQVGGLNASHGIYAEDSNQLLLSKLVMFPSVGNPFSTAAIEFGRAAGGHDVSKGHIKDCIIRNQIVGTKISSVITCLLTRVTHIDCTTCSLIGTPTSTAYAVGYVGCTFEARIGETGVRVQRANGVTFDAECQFDAWDNTHFGFEILPTASLADAISFFGSKFTGNTVPSGAKIDFAAATVNFYGCFFSGFTTSGIKNSNNKFINIDGCHSDDVAIPVIDSVTIGSVRISGTDTAGTVIKDQIGGSTTGVAIRSFAELGGGSQPTTGLVRFPKPSEQSILAVIRREASAIDIPILTSTTDTGLIVGDIATGTFNVLKFQATNQIETFTPTIFMRDGGSTIRGTWTIAAATIFDMAAGGSLAIKNNGTVRFTTVNAKPTITGALSTVVDPSTKAVLTSIIAALKVTTGIDVAIDGTT